MCDSFQILQMAWAIWIALTSLCYILAFFRGEKTVKPSTPAAAKPGTTRPEGVLGYRMPPILPYATHTTYNPPGAPVPPSPARPGPTRPDVSQRSSGFWSSPSSARERAPCITVACGYGMASLSGMPRSCRPTWRGGAASMTPVNTNGV